MHRAPRGQETENENHGRGVVDWYSWFHMRKCILLIVLSSVCQVGCAERERTSQPANFLPLQPVRGTAVQPHFEPSIPRPLSDTEVRDMVNAANQLAMFGTPFPNSVLQRIKPVEIYNDLANVVVALHREAHEEQGYYIVTPISSYLPAGHDRGFSWERLDFSQAPGIFPDVYVYRRTR